VRYRRDQDTSDRIRGIGKLHIRCAIRFDSDPHFPTLEPVFTFILRHETASSFQGRRGLSQNENMVEQWTMRWRYKLICGIVWLSEQNIGSLHISEETFQFYEYVGMHAGR
jgi:hypothetical protein